MNQEQEFRNSGVPEFAGYLLVRVSEPRPRGSLQGIPLRGFLRPPRLDSHPHRLLWYGHPLMWIYKSLGIQEFWSMDLQEFRNSEVQEFVGKLHPDLGQPPGHPPSRFLQLLRAVSYPHTLLSCSLPMIWIYGVQEFWNSGVCW